MEKIVLIIAFVLLAMGAPLAYAQERGLGVLPMSKNQTADILSGLEHGKADVKAGCDHPDGCHWWILIRGNGFVNQTQDFVRGYIHGFCSDPSEAGGGGSDADQAAFRCDKGPEDAGWEPGKIPDSDFWTPKLSR